jgi:hypothetical protein
MAYSDSTEEGEPVVHEAQTVIVLQQIDGAAAAAAAAAAAPAPTPAALPNMETIAKASKGPQLPAVQRLSKRGKGEPTVQEVPVLASVASSAK